MRSRQRGTWGWLGLALVALACVRAQATANPDDPPELRSRELQVELASSDNFYLELDPQARLLELKLAGVVLRSYPLQSVQIRVPRIAFVRVDRPRDWGLRIWSGPKLDPERPQNRIEYNPTSRDTVTDTLATVVKLLLEGLKPIKVPPEYRIRFDGGLSLAVTSPADSAGGSVLSRMRSRMQDLGDVLANRRLQMRLELARTDAEHLYRALPPDTRLVVLSGARHVVEPAGKSKVLAGTAVRPPTSPAGSAPTTTVMPAGAIPESGGHPAESTSTRPASAPGEDSAPPAPPDSGASAPDSAAAPDSVAPGLPPGSLQ
jgi:hypothetical protein